MSRFIPSTTPLQVFEDNQSVASAVAVFPDKRRIITSSHDKTLRLWDLRTGVMLKKMEGHRDRVLALVVSKDGQLIASGDESGEVIAWRGETGEPLTSRPIKAHSHGISSLDFSPDTTELVTGSGDCGVNLWNTTTWERPEMGPKPIYWSSSVRCVRYSPSGELLAIATDNNINIFNPETRKCAASFEAHKTGNMSIAWVPDGNRLLSGGNSFDPTIREWDTLTWNQVGDPWTGHMGSIKAIAINPAGTLAASASEDSDVRLWQLSDRRTITIFKHSYPMQYVTFSIDGERLLSGGEDKKTSEWAVPNLGINSNILAINMISRNALITGDLSTAEELLTQEININTNDYTSYANRSFVLARKNDWDRALDDAIKSISIQPSLTGYISKGIAHCGKGHVLDTRISFNIAFLFTNQESEAVHFLLLIKVIALFNLDQLEEAMLLLKELAATRPNPDIFACRVVEAHLRVQLGIKALNDARHNEAVEYFTAAINSSAFSSNFIREDFVVLFGWDLKSLWQKAHQKQCDARLQAGRFEEAVQSFQHMMDTIDNSTKASCLDWSNAFKEECSTHCLANGDAALAASNYDKAINLYSAAIDLNSASHVVFVRRSKAKSDKTLWDDALLDAQKAIELDPSSYAGYQVKHAALRGAQRYDEAIEAFRIMLSKLDNAPEAQIRELRQQYVSPPEVEDAIQTVAWTELESAPLRLLNTSTGLLCDRAAQMNSFKTSATYKELLSFTTQHSDLEMERIKDVAAVYFRRVLLSHKWEETEPLLHNIQDKVVYELDAVGSSVKLQSFCKIARDAGYYWAWMDTCCIDKNNNTEVEETIDSMFIWYRHSALTIVYLCDVPPSSGSGALANSVWNKRGWTLPELVASRVVLFYRKDWSLYLDDQSPNHKESPAIMTELESVTGIDARALVTFCPGMNNAREKLRWASMRDTTLQEDIVYSLFGIFGIHLPILYGENKHNALGRLLQEIVTWSGDITVLDWVGQSSGFNSCVPANITSYATLSHTVPPQSEDDIQTTVSLLQGNARVVNLALMLYDELARMSPPRFTNCKLHLPCIAFRVVEVNRRSSPAQETNFTYEVKSNGLHDLRIVTEEVLMQSTRPPTLQMFLLVLPLNRHLLELPDFTEPPASDDTQSEDDYWIVPQSPSDDSLSDCPDPESHSRALRLLVRLGKPFSAFFLARQRGGEYKRLASDHDIIAQVKDITAVGAMMDVRTVEIL
ncbi:hypothetical protein BDR07DRAFT_1332384 [Suillus spraguei]|nr:hypothetical protein BDR07DRAFT_1332384 [Suillus spraguei]